MNYKFIGRQLLAAMDITDQDDIIQAIAMQPLLDGQYPYVRWAYIKRMEKGSPWHPDGATVLSSSGSLNTPGGYETIEGEGYRAFIRKENTRVTVVAVTDDRALEVLEEIQKVVKTKPERTEGTIGMEFWRRTNHGAISETKRVPKRQWSDIEHNYPQAARTALTDLMGMTEESLGGKLLLLYGPPGTGKTSALAAMAHEWKKWCSVDCVVDPEVLFTDAAYLNELLTAIATDKNGDDELDEMMDEYDDRHRLIIVEDCDELIRAGQGGGQALARLLNATDGLLGQSSNLLIAITTNEDISALHPAVTRPGRCMAQIEIGKLPPDEATAWLGAPLPPQYSRDGATLAELYFLKSGMKAMKAEIPTEQFGQYL